jgi:hypothetical protein
MRGGMLLTNLTARLTYAPSIFQLYRGGQLLVEETGVPGENH